jgi:hypothetical protein
MLVGLPRRKVCVFFVIFWGNNRCRNVKLDSFFHAPSLVILEVNCLLREGKSFGGTTMRKFFFYDGHTLCCVEFNWTPVCVQINVHKYVICAGDGGMRILLWILGNGV